MAQITITCGFGSISALKVQPVKSLRPIATARPGLQACVSIHTAFTHQWSVRDWKVNLSQSPTKWSEQFLDQSFGSQSEPIDSFYPQLSLIWVPTFGWELEENHFIFIAESLSVAPHEVLSSFLLPDRFAIDAIFHKFKTVHCLKIRFDFKICLLSTLLWELWRHQIHLFTNTRGMSIKYLNSRGGEYYARCIWRHLWRQQRLPGKRHLTMALQRLQSLTLPKRGLGFGELMGDGLVAEGREGIWSVRTAFGFMARAACKHENPSKPLPPASRCHLTLTQQKVHRTKPPQQIFPNTPQRSTK